MLLVYPWLPLLMACGLALALYAAACGRGRADEPWSGLGARPGGGGGHAAVLVAARPRRRLPGAVGQDVPAEPNHALGLVLFPWCCARSPAIRVARAVGVGLLLHLLAWAFVIHMVCGLRPRGLRGARLRDAGDGAPAGHEDVAVVILVNVAIVSPYLVMLLVGYPFLQPTADMVLSARRAHVLETTARLWPVPARAPGDASWRGAAATGWGGLGLPGLVAQMLWVGCLLLSGCRWRARRTSSTTGTAS